MTMESYYEKLQDISVSGMVNDDEELSGAGEKASGSTLNLTTMSTNYSFYDNYTSGEDISNGSGELNDSSLPNELTDMSESSKYCVIAYCILFVIATSGNLTVLGSVYKQYKKSKSRIALLILHLSIADLIVCSTLIPTEVFWRVTIQWRGGNVLCKTMQFLRAFGLHLSSMVLICVSFDRFFAILYPMKMLRGQGHHIIKVMLWIAWSAAAAFSAPQAILFSLESHPEFPSFKQCVTNEFLKNTEDVRMYSIFSVSAMYFVPLIVILFTYTAILIKIIRKTHQNHQPVQAAEEHQRQQQSSTQSRQIIQLRMRIRNVSGRQQNPESTNVRNSNHSVGRDSAMNTCNNTLNPVMQQQNHSRLSVTMGCQGRRKFYNSSSKPGDYSSEGSCSGSIRSTVNMTRVNIPTIDSRGGGRLHMAQQQHPSKQSKVSQSTSPKTVTICTPNSHHTQLVLRRSENAAEQMTRAKNRTLVMTIVIVVMFVLCWTPYVVMTLWYMFDWEGAKEVDPRIQDGLFVMAVANSCVNPLIYGTFTKNCCGLSKIFGRMRPTCVQ